MAEPGMPMAEVLRERLSETFSPDYLEVVDESEDHRGHDGWHEGGGTHFRVVMRAESLAGLSRVARSRAVHRALEAEIAGGVHALALDLAGPETPVGQARGQAGGPGR